VHPRRESHLELRPDPVGAADHHRLIDPDRHSTQSGKAADVGENFGDAGGLREGLDPLDQLVAGIGVYSGLPVRDGHGFFFTQIRSARRRPQPARRA
jgi:hypothetical protein